MLTLTRTAEALDVAPGELLDSAITDDDRVTGIPTPNTPPAATPDQLPRPHPQLTARRWLRDHAGTRRALESWNDRDQACEMQR